MAETITPVVHGGRRGRWAISVALHTIGATGSAAAFGAMLGVAGRLLGAPWGLAGRLLIVAVASAYALREIAGLRVPIPDRRRQVPQWWRERLGPHPAALLYGSGLGVGFFTYLRHGTLVAVCAVAVAAGDPVLGSILLAAFGSARGLGLLAAYDATTPDGVERTAARIERWSRWARPANGLALVAVAGVAWLLLPGRPSATPSAAALALALVFGAAATAKLLDPASWRSALRGYALPRWLERGASLLVPLVELAVAALVLAGRPALAGVGALGLLTAFSWSIARARRLRGKRLPCGCFGGSKVRSVRFLLWRNALLAVLAGTVLATSSRGIELRLPGPGETLPALLVGISVAVALVAARAARALRAG